MWLFSWLHLPLFSLPGLGLKNEIKQKKPKIIHTKNRFFFLSWVWNSQLILFTEFKSLNSATTGVFFLQLFYICLCDLKLNNKKHIFLCSEYKSEAIGWSYIGLKRYTKTFMERVSKSIMPEKVGTT